MGSEMCIRDRHSWLVVAMHQSERTPERVGFYYSANALGRLLGTLVSGACFQAATPDRSLVVCLLASCCAVLVATACTARVRSSLPRAPASDVPSP